MPARSAKRPRRKAKQERSRRTVDVLLEAGARVLERRGYAAATTNRIAEAAGVSVGTLYEYFADKDALFDALIQRELAVIVAAVEGAGLGAGAPIGQQLERLLRVAMEALPRGPDFIRALEQVPGSVLRRRLVRARAAVVAAVRALLEVHRDELRVHDLELAATIVVGAAEGIATNARAEDFDERLAGEVGALLSLYLTGREAR